MSATIDDRVVSMTFRGTSFLSGIKNTISALTGLKNGLNGLKGSTRSINDLDSAGRKFSLKGMADQADNVAKHLDLMRIAGVAIFAHFVIKAAEAGFQIAKSLTIDPIKQGLDVYETKINAIQTILANTSAAGTTLHQVTAALNQLNVYANKTVYNFGQMAQNIGTFTSAGVGLKTAVASIKGIANLAALSGSSAEQASTAMYQLSQSIASGTVKLQDWNSVVNAGLGGKVFQNALIETARVHGVEIDKMIKKDHGFRNTLQEGWLTSKILTQTLNTFTGDLSASQLRALGYTKQQTAAILKQAKAAVDSATKIRTITQLQQALREEVATAWAGVWEALIGNINDASTLLSHVHDVLETAFTGPVNKLAEFIKEFVKLGGRDDVVRAISNAFKVLGSILGPIKAAFREIFPPITAEILERITKNLADFLAKLELSADAQSKLKTAFEGIFSILKIAFDLIAGVGHALGIMFGVAASGGGGFLDLAAKIGAFITRVKDAIESGTALARFFTFLGNVLALPVRAIEGIINALGGFAAVLGKVASFVSGFVHKIGEGFSKLGDAIGQGIKSGNFEQVVSILNHVLLGGVLLAIRKFILKLASGSGGSGLDGLFSTIKESFEGLTGALTAMQTNLKSGTLQKIAIAVALLAASLVVLSLIDVANLTKALTAITIMFTELLGAMAVAIKVGGSAGIVRMQAIGIALNILAAAIIILAAAVAILAQFSWSQLARGLSAIAVLLTELVAATLAMSTDSKGLIAAAFAMKTMAVALDILALAVAHLGKLDFGTLAKGVVSIAALLGILRTFGSFSGEGLISSAAAMIILGAALNIIALAVRSLGSLSLSTIGKGLLAIAGALGIMVIALAAMPPSTIVSAGALLIVSAALVIMSKALAALGNMSWSSIGKSLVELAGSLAIVAAAMIAMESALPGAAALLVVSAALSILVPVLIALGNLSWGSILKGLVALAGLFLVIAAAGLLLTPVIPTLLGLGAAVALLGVGVLAAGVGIGLLAAGITALAVAVAASGAAILSFVKNILSIIPTAFAEIGKGIVAFAVAIGNGASAIADAIVKILSAILKGIGKIIPLIAKTFEKILGSFLDIIEKDSPKVIHTFLQLILTVLTNLEKYMPKFVDKGAKLLISLLNGISSKISSVVKAGVNLIISFINAIGAGTVKIVKAGINMMIALVNGIANGINANIPRMRSAALNLAFAIINGLTFGILSGGSRVLSALISIASNALSKVKGFLGISSPSKKFMEVGKFMVLGMAIGAENSTGIVEDSMTRIGNAAAEALAEAMAGIGDILEANMDLNPRITPVIDLSRARQGFSDLGRMSKAQLIAATASSTSASSISASNQAAAAIQAKVADTAAASLTFNQYNSSPKALSTIDIYRGTKNQLSRVKGALTK